MQNNQSSFLEQMKLHGIHELVVTSFEEAQKSERRRNVVYVQNEEFNTCSIYVTYKIGNETLGEYISWINLDISTTSIGILEVIITCITNIYAISNSDLDQGRILAPGEFEFKPYT